MLQSMGSQRVGHGSATELTDLPLLLPYGDNTTASSTELYLQRDYIASK